MANRTLPLVSVVIPAYREEKNVPLVYRELLTLFARLSRRYRFEIVFVNDWSSDRTWKQISDLCDSDGRVKWIDLSRNFGHQAALTAGLEIATGDVAVSMDCDMQDPPALVEEMLEKWEAGFEVVYARRRNRNDPFLKKYTALAYYRVLSAVSDTKIPRNVGDFRLVDRKVLDAFLGLKEKDRYIRGMFSWLGFKTAFVDFDRPERIHGETGYTWSKMAKLATDGIMNFSVFPLKLGAFIGVGMILLSIVFFSYVAFDALVYGVEYPLYKWLSIAAFGFMGLQFVFMWIIGEYIGRIYNETRNRPVYLIRKSRNV